MLVCADNIELVNLFYDLLIQWQDIGRLDMRRLVFFEKVESVSGHQQGLENGLLARVEWGGTVGRIRHCRSGSSK